MVIYNILFYISFIKYAPCFKLFFPVYNCSRFGNERAFATTSSTNADRERLSLTSLEVITDALLEIMEACMRDIPNCDWLHTW